MYSLKVMCQCAVKFYLAFSPSLSGVLVATYKEQEVIARELPIWEPNDRKELQPMCNPKHTIKSPTILY